MQMGSWVLLEMSIRVLLFPKYVIDECEYMRPGNIRIWNLQESLQLILNCFTLKDVY